MKIHRSSDLWSESFTIPTESMVNLSIYNITGQKVRTLASEPMTMGKHTICWDGRSDSGQAVSSCVYRTYQYRRIYCVKKYDADEMNTALYTPKGVLGCLKYTKGLYEAIIKNLFHYCINLSGIVI